MNSKVKYKARWNRILVVLLVPVIVIFLFYFSFIKDYERERLLRIGYHNEEISTIRDHLVKEERKVLLDYSYLPYLVDLVGNENYHSERLLSYIDYISKLSLDYTVEDVIFLVNNQVSFPYTEKLVNLMHHDYFILSRLDRYMNFDSNDISEIITSVNSNLDYEFYTNPIPVDASRGKLLLVNKYYSLKEEYQASNLVTMDSAYSNHQGSELNQEAYEAFKRLVDSAEQEGYHIRNNYAYRSYDDQNGIYEDYKKKYGITYADQNAARPGHSEHQTGFSLDVGVQTKYVVGKFGDSREFTWMKDHAHLYGFILRYPKEKENITGYVYEPWHYRYVGVEVASYIYEHQITFDEYYAYFIEK